MGCMVSSKGIEANPNKVQAIIGMKSPKTIREVQILNGRIIALGRFISSFAKRCLPFYRSLKNIKQFKWGDDCQQAFEDLKRFLTTPPLISRPISGDTLFLYLAACKEAVASVLVRKEGSQ